MIFPEYIKSDKLGNCCMRKEQDLGGSAEYYRDAGDWSMVVTEEVGVLVGAPLETKHVWVACTEEEWGDDNKGYV